MAASSSRKGRAGFKRTAKAAGKMREVYSSPLPTFEQADAFADRIEVLGGRVRHVLSMLAVDTPDKLLALSKQDVMSIRGMGEGTWHEITNLQRHTSMHPQAMCEALPAPPIDATQFPLFSKRDISAQSLQNVPSSLAPPLPVETIGLRNEALRCVLRRGIITLHELMMQAGRSIVTGLGASGRRVIREIRTKTQEAIAECRPVAYLTQPITGVRLHRLPLFAGLPLPGVGEQGFHPTYRASQAIAALPFTQPVRDALCAAGITSLGALLVTTESTLADRCGLTIGAPYGLRGAVRGILIGPSVNGYIPADSFDGMLSGYVCHVLDNRRHRGIVLKRLGVHQGHPATLEAIARHYRISKERVRQYLERFRTMLSMQYNLQTIDAFRGAVVAQLERSGGLAGVEELRTGIASAMGWSQPPAGDKLAAFLAISSICEIQEDGLVAVQGFPCSGCASASSALAAVIEAAGAVPLGSVSGPMLAHCRGMCPQPERMPPVIPPALLAHLAQTDQRLRTEGVQLEEGVFYRRDRWTMAYGPLPQAIAAILAEAGVPLHRRQLLRQLASVRRKRPCSIRGLSDALTRTPAAVLWAKGTHIHSRFVSVPRDLISRVEAWLLQSLAVGVSSVSATGAFHQFRAECLAEGVRSQWRLYGILRLCAHPELRYLRFPFVCQAGTAKRLPVAATVEAMIKQSALPVPQDELDTLLRKRMLMSDMQVSNLRSQLSRVLTSKNGLVHVDNLPIRDDGLAAVVGHVRAAVRLHARVSLEELYAELADVCRSMGIGSPEILYQVLRLRAPADLRFQRFPHVRATSDAGHSLAGDVIEFVRRMGRPCTKAELIELFATGRGYNPGSVWACKYKPALAPYVPGSIVHLQTIGWHRPKQRQLDEAALSAFNEEVQAGGCFARVDRLIERHAARLPALSASCQWTPELAAHLLRSGGKARLLGNSRNCYVCVPNGIGIETFDDLLVELLKRHFGSAADVTVFSDFLRRERITANVLTPAAVARPGRLVFEQSTIRIRENQ